MPEEIDGEASEGDHDEEHTSAAGDITMGLIGLLMIAGSVTGYVVPFEPAPDKSEAVFYINEIEGVDLDSGMTVHDLYDICSADSSVVEFLDDRGLGERIQDREKAIETVKDQYDCSWYPVLSWVLYVMGFVGAGFIVAAKKDLKR